jgi:hypothetical protein
MATKPFHYRFSKEHFMSEQTVNLSLPYILSSQAQKHVTHNEALRRLDGLVQLVVQSETSTPPSSPSEGACHAIGSAPTGAWTGKAGKIALFEDGAWIYLTPRAGWTGWFENASRQKIWTGSTWVDLLTESEISQIGINASADATNRLVVSAAATLLNHAGAGHQLKINKADDGDTGSLMFQTGFSGRAEMGLSGSDDFEIKVSADGSAWATALKTSSSGAVLMPGRSLVRASYGETALTPANNTRTGFGTLHLNQGGFALGATVTSGVGSRLTVPVTGFYMITLNVSSLAAASYSVAVQQNGSTNLLTVRDSDTGSQSYSQSATSLAYLTAGDWIALHHTGTAEFQFGYGKTELVMALM